jgi:hypothetical protein
MTKDIQKIRRVINLCVLFTRNMAYYKAGYLCLKKSSVKSDFIITTWGNFIDVAVLEWCKLFGSYKDHHHWNNIFENEIDEFRKLLLKQIGMSKHEFESYHHTMKNYRDVFAAHWDNDAEGKIPTLDSALECVVFLHAYVFQNFYNINALNDKVKDLSLYYDICFKEAEFHYKKLIN